MHLLAEFRLGSSKTGVCYFVFVIVKLRTIGTLIRHSWRVLQAAARHHCSYLVYQAATGFLLSDGNPVWLRGIDHASQRMRNLAELNKLMAHRPWLIRKSHFEVGEFCHQIKVML